MTHVARLIQWLLHNHLKRTKQCVFPSYNFYIKQIKENCIKKCCTFLKSVFFFMYLILVFKRNGMALAIYILNSGGCRCHFILKWCVALTYDTFSCTCKVHVLLCVLCVHPKGDTLFLEENWRCITDRISFQL